MHKCKCLGLISKSVTVRLKHVYISKGDPKEVFSIKVMFFTFLHISPNLLHYWVLVTFKLCQSKEQFYGLRRHGTYIQHNTTQARKKKNKIMPFLATWIQLEIIILSEVSQKEKDKYHIISFICGI